MPHALLAAALGISALDWIAVARRNRRAEYVLKPAAIAGLIAAAAAFAAREDSRQAAFTIAALAFSLAGDVFLMLPRNAFLGGLGAFLVAHLCYVAGFLPVPPLPVAIAAAAVAMFAVPYAARILRALTARGRGALRAPVAVYAAVIGAMAATAAGFAFRAGVPARAGAAALAGATLFVASDAMIAWRRFVAERAWMPVAIMVLYHLGQSGLVLALDR